MMLLFTLGKIGRKKPAIAFNVCRRKIDPATDTDPGRIAEGYFVVDFDITSDGYINVTDMSGEHVGGPGEPVTVVRGD
jgi:hypothetical protein